MKLLIFDLGNTLVKYSGIPLNWSEHYSKALLRAAQRLKVAPSKDDIVLATEILSFYNTRLNMRTFEIHEGEVLNKIAKIFKCDYQKLEETFFEYFQRKTQINKATIDTLKQLKEKSNKVMIYTDVPYGMPRRLVMQDIHSISEYIDEIFTSCDTGFRKPNINCFKTIIENESIPKKDIYYIGDEEKDILCANVNGINSVLLKNKKISTQPNYVIENIQEILDIIDKN